jgi:hypothetical protein
VPPRSEPFRSYFDTTLGYIFFNIPAADAPEVVEELAAARRSRRESERKRLEYAEYLATWVRLRHYPLMAHEWAHALQVLTHPALFLRCLREFSAVCTVCDELRRAPEMAPVPLTPERSWTEELAWPTVPVRISVREDGAADAKAATGRPMPNDISETDLLEDSASVFQYKAEIGGEGSVEGYRRWLAEGRKYLYAKTFEFLAATLSPADAYVALAPLVMAAFGTVLPVHTFVSLLAITLREAPAPPRELGADRYFLYLQLVLEESLETGRMPEPRRQLHQEAEQRRIDRETVLGLAEGMPSHPMSPVVERAWRDEAAIERLREAILHPHLAFDRRSRDSQRWLEPFRPAVTAFRMLDSGMDVGDTPLYVSPTLVEGGFQPGGMSWQEYLIQLLRIKTFVFAVATPFLRPLPHHCPHTDCRYHEFDMCRAWMNVPAQPDGCGFPEWLANVVNRRLDFSSRMLVPVD